jgi:hypothetical protein
MKTKLSSEVVSVHEEHNMKKKGQSEVQRTESEMITEKKREAATSAIACLCSKNMIILPRFKVTRCVTAPM